MVRHFLAIGIVLAGTILAVVVLTMSECKSIRLPSRGDDGKVYSQQRDAEPNDGKHGVEGTALERKQVVPSLQGPNGLLIAGDGDDRWTLKGRVVDCDGNGVAGASVVVSWVRQERAARTDAVGRFEMRLAQLGRFRVFAGCGDAGVGMAEVAAGMPGTYEVVVVLGECAETRLHVMTESGVSVGRAFVELLVGAGGGESVCSWTCDDHGLLDLRWITACRWIRVSGRGVCRVFALGDAGREQHVVLARGQEVRGRVVDAGERSAVYANLVHSRYEELISMAELALAETGVQCDREGEFSFGEMRPGTYEAWCVAPSGRGGPVRFEVPLREPLVLECVGCELVEVMVLDGGGRPASGCEAGIWIGSDAGDMPPEDIWGRWGDACVVKLSEMQGKVPLPVSDDWCGIGFRLAGHLDKAVKIDDLRKLGWCVRLEPSGLIVVNGAKAPRDSCWVLRVLNNNGEEVRKMIVPNARLWDSVEMDVPLGRYRVEAMLRSTMSSPGWTLPGEFAVVGEDWCFLGERVVESAGGEEGLGLAEIPCGVIVLCIRWDGRGVVGGAVEWSLGGLGGESQGAGRRGWAKCDDRGCARIGWYGKRQVELRFRNQGNGWSRPVDMAVGISGRRIEQVVVDLDSSEVWLNGNWGKF